LETYPYCRGRIAPRRYLYIGGTYDRPGKPAVVLIVGRRSIQP
jgi:hypothetical protein